MNGLLIRNSFVCLKRSFAALYFAWLVKMCSVYVHTMSPAQRLTEKPYESSCGVIRLVSSKVQTHFNDPLFSCLFSFFALHTPICERTNDRMARNCEENLPKPRIICLLVVCVCVALDTGQGVMIFRLLYLSNLQISLALCMCACTFFICLLPVMCNHKCASEMFTARVWVYCIIVALST